VNFNNEINERVQAYLSKKRMSQKDLYEATGITQSELSLLLAGKRNWTLNLLAVLAKHTGLVFKLGSGGIDGD
jgi:DNA-binding Xre family transcriptional regulator